MWILDVEFILLSVFGRSQISSHERQALFRWFQLLCRRVCVSIVTTCARRLWVGSFGDVERCDIFGALLQSFHGIFGDVERCGHYYIGIPDHKQLQLHA